MKSPARQASLAGVYGGEGRARPGDLIRSAIPGAPKRRKAGELGEPGLEVLGFADFRDFSKMFSLDFE